MKQIFTIAILLLLFACGEDKKSVQNNIVDVEMKQENITGEWALIRKETHYFIEDSILVSTDTMDYDYNLVLNSDSSLIWEGSVYQDWGNVEKEQKLNGNGDGNWFFEVDANLVDTTYIARINLFDVYTFEGSEYTEHLKVIGVIVKLTNEEMFIETYGSISNDTNRTTKHYFERVE